MLPLPDNARGTASILRRVGTARQDEANGRCPGTRRYIIVVQRTDPPDLSRWDRVTLASIKPAEIEMLSRLSIFAGVKRDDLQDLVGSMKRRAYRKGEVIYHQEDPPGSLFVVSKGSVKMQLVSPAGKTLTIAWIDPGMFFGTISLYGENMRPENAIALEASELLILDRDKLRAFLRSHADATEVLLGIMATRWRTAFGRLHDVVFLDVPTRMAKVILDLSDRPGLAAPEDRDLIKNLSQPELAAFVGTSRESVNKWLQSFARQGWVEFDRGGVRVLNHAALQHHLDQNE